MIELQIPTYVYYVIPLYALPIRLYNTIFNSNQTFLLDLF